jgi:hypothetical protein
VPLDAHNKNGRFTVESLYGCTQQHTRRRQISLYFFILR